MVSDNLKGRTKMKISQFDRAACKTVEKAALEALQKVAADLGLTVRWEGGRFQSTDLTAKFKFSALTVSTGTGSGIPADFARLASQFGLKPEHFGADVVLNGTTYKITGLNARRGKFPVLVERVKDGKAFKLTLDSVTRGLGLGGGQTAKYKVGDKVRFSYFGGQVRFGTVDSVNQGQYIVFANGEMFNLPESRMEPASPRTEDEIMADFSAAYNGLSPENLCCDGELPMHAVSRKRALLNRWLRELTTELGRGVSENEASDWWMKNRRNSSLA